MLSVCVVFTYSSVIHILNAHPSILLKSKGRSPIGVNGEVKVHPQETNSTRDKRQEGFLKMSYKRLGTYSSEVKLCIILK
jgi:hypothetical protein